MFIVFINCKTVIEERLPIVEEKLNFKIKHGSLNSIFWHSLIYNPQTMSNLFALFAFVVLITIFCLVNFLETLTGKSLLSEYYKIVGAGTFTVYAIIVLILWYSIPDDKGTADKNAQIIKIYFKNIDDGLCSFKNRLENLLLFEKSVFTEIFQSLLVSKFVNFIVLIYGISLVLFVINILFAIKSISLVSLVPLIPLLLSLCSIIILKNNNNHFNENIASFRLNNKLQYEEIIQLLPILRTVNTLDKYINKYQPDESFTAKLESILDIFLNKIVTVIVCLILLLVMIFLENEISYKTHDNTEKLRKNLLMRDGISFLFFSLLINLNMISRKNISSMILWRFCLDYIPVKDVTKCIPLKRDEFIESITFDDADIGYASYKNGIYSHILNIGKNEQVTLSEGNIYYLKGQSGSGKTTLIRALCGSAKISPKQNAKSQVVVKTNKEREINFEDLHQDVLLDDVIVAAQENNFPKATITVLQYLLTFQDIAKIQTGVITEVAKEIGLKEEFLNKNMGFAGLYLSIQEGALLKTLVLLLRAYFGSSNDKVSILIFDEIFDCISNSEDISSNYGNKNENVEKILKYIQKMNVTQEKIIIICGHNEKLISHFCNKVINIKNGEGELLNLNGGNND